MYETITTNMMVENVTESIAFYVENLGFEVVVSVPDEEQGLQFAILAKDRISLMLQSKKSLVNEYPALACESIQPCFTLFITVCEIHQLYEEVKGKVTIAKEMHQTFYGKNEFALFDNNGMILTISD